MSKIKPILFSTEMVQAIMEGRKTQTRRIIKLPVIENKRYAGGAYIEHKSGERTALEYHGNLPSPFKKGEILWVRESVKILSYKNIGSTYDYVYDYQFESDNTVVNRDKIPQRIVVNHINDLLYPKQYGTWLTKKQKVPNGCLKEMARLFLEVTNVRVERLQDISEDDAIAEGIEIIENEKYGRVFRNYFMGDQEHYFKVPELSFQSLWIKINGRASWDANPWVWVYEFKRVEKPQNFLS